MPNYSIAQTLPAELLELVFKAVVELDKEEILADFDIDHELTGAPARRVGINLKPTERRFCGSSDCLFDYLTVCKQWYP